MTAWVNVIFGCNERCTYCIVPFTRGQEQSRTPGEMERQLGQQGLGGRAAGAASKPHVRPGAEQNAG